MLSPATITPLGSYRGNAALWSRLRAADSLAALRMLLTEMRDGGELAWLAGQVLAAPPALTPVAAAAEPAAAAAPC